METPSLAVVTPCFNSSATLERCLASVHGQTVPVEHQVVDGASSDGSAERARAFAQRGVRGSLTVVSEPDGGMYDAMNKGILRCRSEIIGILNADDTYAAPDVLEGVLQAFADPSLDAVFGDIVVVPPPPSRRVIRVWRNGPYDVRRFWSGWMPPHPAFFLRRQRYEQLGLYRTDFSTAADYELILRMLVRHRLTAAGLPRILVRMQAGGASNRSLRARLSAHALDRRAWRVNGLAPLPWTLLLKPLRKVVQWFVRPAPATPFPPGDPA